VSKTRKATASGTLLDLWRPPERAGDPIGCLATTYTFAPGLFDEQCLARFLEIESEPNREDLAFLLERERLLGGVYAGVLVDHTQAGVEHSLRWDVLPVRVPAGKQHAKLSLLVWSQHVRIVVASANLTEQGYRTNYEVAAAVDVKPDAADAELFGEAVAFLRRLIRLVPGSATRPPEVQRADGFLDQVEGQVRNWKAPGRKGVLRQRLVFTLPADGPGRPARGALDEAVDACRGRGSSPYEVWVASPFFDTDEGAARVTASLCKLMARGVERDVWFSLPADRSEGRVGVPRLCAPKTLVSTPPKYEASAHVEVLPDLDQEKNRRPWHAKMVALRANGYLALMIGSSNFTVAGMGVGGRHHAEANLLTIADREAYGREAGLLEAVWPEVETIADQEAVEWLGPRPDGEEEEEAQAAPLPGGFLSATYRAGDERRVVLRFEPAELPVEWEILAAGREPRELLAAATWGQLGRPTSVELPWQPVESPEKLLVRWAGNEAFLPLNVDDSRELPPPAQLERMSADDMLLILAASGPSAAFRAWAKEQRQNDEFNSDLDSAAPVDLDPLRRYDLQATFLHRIRRRARVLAQLRSNLERPVWARQALEWRLRGMIGVEALAERLANEVESGRGAIDESVLALADFLIVLRAVDYQPSDGSLPKAEFEQLFRPFLAELSNKLHQRVDLLRANSAKDVVAFWLRVVERCRA